MPRNIVLASASPRRRDLLRQHGFAVEMIPSHAPEMLPDFLTVAETTLLNARIKAAHVARQRPDALVLAADTLVALDGEALGKPADMDEAFAMLSRLSGRTHEVFSGVWLEHRAEGRRRGFIAGSRVKFRRMKPAEIREYMERVQPLDKAGAYAAQKNEMNLIESVEGSYTNVIGLPMEPLTEALKDF
jgi:septum formation protein